MSTPILTLKQMADGRSDLFKIDIRKLSLDPGFNERKDLGDLDLLCKQIIAAGGILRPLSVRMEGGRVLVTDGERRWRSGNMAIERGFNLPPVPCVPDPRNATAEQRTLSLILLNSGKPLTMLEQARVYRRLHAEHGWDSERIAKEAGPSRTHIANCLALCSLPEPLQQAIAEEKISATLVLELVGEAKGDLAAAAVAVESALSAAGEAGKNKATRKHVPAGPAKDPPPGSSLDADGKTGVEAIKNAASGGGGSPHQSTGEGGTADSRTTKLNKLLESTPREKCDQAVFDLLEVLVDYLENRRPLGDVKNKLLLPAA